MSKIVTYRGCTIQSAPCRIGNSEKWGLHIVISVDDIRNVRTREFSSDAVYATEQEAEIHGIAFGQRIIDGKVEGQFGVDMKPSNRRAMPRLPGQFQAAFSDMKLEGNGIMLDLSPSGCRIESPNPVEPGTSLELHIYAPDFRWPIMVEEATVQWVRDQTFGLAFFRITEVEQQRLGKVVRTLTEGRVIGGRPAHVTCSSHQVHTRPEQRM